jgi:hypothetical protein
VPVAAAGQADVGAADAQPVVLGGGGKQVLEELAVVLLDGVALGERPLRLGDPGRERIADALEPAEIEDPRRPGRGDPVRDVHPSQPLGDECGKLALKSTDLPPQLGAGTQLVDACNPLGEERRPATLYLRLPVEQIRHRGILSRPEGGGGNP